MATFSASAPGKVILFGEHAVVHGASCIAASIDLRTSVNVYLPGGQSEGQGVASPNERGGRDHEIHEVILELPGLNMEWRWHPDQLRVLVQSSGGEKVR